MPSSVSGWPKATVRPGPNLIFIPTPSFGPSWLSFLVPVQRANPFLHSRTCAGSPQGPSTVQSAEDEEDAALGGLWSHPAPPDHLPVAQQAALPLILALPRPLGPAPAHLPLLHFATDDIIPMHQP